MKKFLFVLAFLGFIVACSEKVNPDDGGKPQDKVISVTGITLDITDVSIKAGETVVLSATIIPDNATNKSVKWSSSNDDVATVDNNGKVTGIKEGSATITVTTVDGGKTATCTVKVAKPTAGTGNGLELVNLGLSSRLKWATCNVGANSPEEFGDYYAWGETEPYYSCQDPLTWKKGKSAGYYWASYQWGSSTNSTIKLTKYNTNSVFGPVVDNILTLELTDDAARANWGGNWRMPTEGEWTELRTECTWTWTTQNGVNGMLVTGPNGNSIFFPAAGYRNEKNLDSPGSLDYAGSIGHYWSSSLRKDNPTLAWGVQFSPSYVILSGFQRCYGQAVRPVTE